MFPASKGGGNILLGQGAQFHYISFYFLLRFLKNYQVLSLRGCKKPGRIFKVVWLQVTTIGFIAMICFYGANTLLSLCINHNLLLKRKSIFCETCQISSISSCHSVPVHNIYKHQNYTRKKHYALFRRSVKNASLFARIVYKQFSHNQFCIVLKVAPRMWTQVQSINCFYRLN